ncbi:HTH domain-containing protein [Candidatus Nitrosarchaeum limnium]|uniref:HTH domain-containing protein n=1 Tax=Candidatus Nitrosarchaeum limnium TaxID=1007084 RepID=UPI003B8358D2
MYNSYDSQGLVKVLTFLKAHNTEYLSGQDLSDVLRISRVAVWKHIKKNKGVRLQNRIKTKARISTRIKYRCIITLGGNIRIKD